MALESVGLTPFVLNTISAVLIIIIAISVILAVKDFIPNFIGGYTFRRKRLFKKGEKIRIGEIEGKIKKINLIDTYIVTSKNDLIIIPNSLFIKSIVQKKNH
jgi:small-conductance mechanosensitive channel